MDKTLGQIAYEKCSKFLLSWADTPEDWRREWEAIASAVAAAVKEEDARICEAWGHECHGEGRDDSEAFDCADHIRASIKEVK